MRLLHQIAGADADADVFEGDGLERAAASERMIVGRQRNLGSLAPRC
jgi:hypothetical protein